MVNSILKYSIIVLCIIVATAEDTKPVKHVGTTTSIRYPRFSPVKSQTEQDPKVGDRRTVIFLMPKEKERSAKTIEYNIQGTTDRSQKIKRRTPSRRAKVALPPSNKNSLHKAIQRDGSKNLEDPYVREKYLKKRIADRRPIVKVIPLKNRKTVRGGVAARSLEHSDQDVNPEEDEALLRVLQEKLYPGDYEIESNRRTRKKPRAGDDSRYVCYCREESEENASGRKGPYRNPNPVQQLWPRKDKSERIGVGEAVLNENGAPRMPAYGQLPENPFIPQHLPIFYPNMPGVPQYDSMPELLGATVETGENVASMPYVPFLYTMPPKPLHFPDTMQQEAPERIDMPLTAIDGDHLVGQNAPTVQETKRKFPCLPIIEKNEYESSTISATATSSDESILGIAQAASTTTDQQSSESGGDVGNSRSNASGSEEDIPSGETFINIDECIKLYGRKVCVISAGTGKTMKGRCRGRGRTDNERNFENENEGSVDSVSRNDSPQNASNYDKDAEEDNNQEQNNTDDNIFDESNNASTEDSVVGNPLESGDISPDHKKLVGASKTENGIATVDYSDIKEVTSSYFTSKAYDNETNESNFNFDNTGPFEDDSTFITSTGPMNDNFPQNHTVDFKVENSENPGKTIVTEDGDNILTESNVTESNLLTKDTTDVKMMNEGARSNTVGKGKTYRTEEEEEYDQDEKPENNGSEEIINTQIGNAESQAVEPEISSPAPHILNNESGNSFAPENKSALLIPNISSESNNEIVGATEEPILQPSDTTTISENGDTKSTVESNAAGRVDSTTDINQDETLSYEENITTSEIPIGTKLIEEQTLETTANSLNDSELAESSKNDTRPCICESTVQETSTSSASLNNPILGAPAEGNFESPLDSSDNLGQTAQESPTKYYSPEDRIINYIKNHQTGAASKATPSPADQNLMELTTTEYPELNEHASTTSEYNVQVPTSNYSSDSSLYSTETAENVGVFKKSKSTIPPSLESPDKIISSEDIKDETSTTSTPDSDELVGIPENTATKPKALEPEIGPAISNNQSPILSKNNWFSTSSGYMKTHEVTTEVQKKITKTTRYFQPVPSGPFTSDPMVFEHSTEDTNISGGSFNGEAEVRKDQLEDRSELVGVERDSSLEDSQFDSAPTDDYSYLGKIVESGTKPNDAHSLQQSDLFYIGDGVKLPLEIKKQSDGSYALSISSRFCERMLNRECPCCVPRKGNIVRSSRRNSQIGENQARQERNTYEVEKTLQRNAKSIKRTIEKQTMRPFALSERFKRSSFNHLENVAMPVEVFAKKYNLSLDLADAQVQWRPDSIEMTNRYDTGKKYRRYGSQSKSVSRESYKKNDKSNLIGALAETGRVQRVSQSTGVYVTSDREPIRTHDRIVTKNYDKIDNIQKDEDKSHLYRYQRNVESNTFRRTEAAKGVLNWFRNLLLGPNANNDSERR